MGLKWLASFLNRTPIFDGHIYIYIWFGKDQKANIVKIAHLEEITLRLQKIKTLSTLIINEYD